VAHRRGDLDILADIPDRHGRHMSYRELVDRVTELNLDEIVVRVAALDDDIASKEWADSRTSPAVASTSR